MRFIAIAKVSCASLLIEPNDIAPVAKRFTISAAGSTSSSETAAPAGLNSNLPHRMLQLADRRRIQLVPLAAHTVLIFAANAEFRVGFIRRLHRKLMFHERFASQHFDPDALDSRGRAGKVFLDKGAAQTDGLKNLRTLVTLQG